MESALIITALLLGLGTSLHCIGMCGPIALSLGLKAENVLKFTTKNLTYQLGRVTTYSLLGLIIGVLGKGISLVGFQQYLTIIAGVLMIAMVLIPRNLSQGNSRFSFLNKALIKLKTTLGEFIRKRNYSSLFTTGMLNGLLPCGPVYIALTGSLVAGSLAGSALFMALFGLGTIPLMFLTVLAGNVISLNTRNKMLKIFPYLMVVIGILFILRGLDLGIPFVSPKAEMLQLNAHECCH